MSTTETAGKTTESEQPADELTEETVRSDNGKRTDPPTDDDPPNDDEQSGDNPELSKVRREAASWRTQFREAEKQLEATRRELFVQQVKATGKLADHTDMPFDAELVDDPDELEAAIDALLEAKPHLKARTFGNIGQHDRPKETGVSLGSILRNNA